MGTVAEWTADSLQELLDSHKASKVLYIIHVYMCVCV